MKVTEITGYNYEQWVWIKNKLDVMTYNRFSCFFDNYILKNKNLYEEFAPMLEQNFKLINSNWDTINSLDFTMMAGGWKNGEISMNKGFSEMLNPELYGKDPKSTVAITDGIKNFLSVWGLFSTAINTNFCNPCCNSCENVCECDIEPAFVSAIGVTNC